jgi:hypothetical protein
LRNVSHPHRPGDDAAPLAPTEKMAEPSAGAVLDAALAQARPGDPAARLLAQARVAEALFGGVASGGLGRFRVLERLGAGGMGVVYAAYDPDLDRGVALKVVPVPARSRDAALAEAKALARLSHPNVVPIYDVGIEGEHVYIVMELVRGETLRRAVLERTPREILDAYRQAGNALAAAHGAGLVHRDFKPDNAIVGSDGRVRVVDFGLACAAADASGTDGDSPPPVVGGTPRYMAPEQAAGAPVTAAADQYSFCVALAEALTAADGKRPPTPLPRWLGAILERGRAESPARRFPSMAELLRALARDPARLHRRRLVWGALGLAAVAAFVAGRQSLDARREPCDDGAGELARAWAPAARATALARLASLGAYGQALAPRLDKALAEHAQRWGEAHRDACLAHRRGAQSDALLDRRMACLGRGRAALAAVGDIVTNANAATLEEVARAVRALPDPASCSDVTALLVDLEPAPPSLAPAIAERRERLARARVAIAAGQLASARADATRIVAAARELAYRPLLAEALLIAGHATLMQDRNAAVPLLTEATTLALGAGADALAVEAWARRAWAQGTSADPTSALAGQEVIEALSARAPAGQFARALLYNNIGSIELAREQRERARVDFERALVASRGLGGDGALELLTTRPNLALVTDEPERRDALLVAAEAEAVRLLGPDHPQALSYRRMRANTTMVDLRATADYLQPTCQADELHPALALETMRCWNELGNLRAELGEMVQAVAALERGLRASGNRNELPEMEPYLLLWRGDAGAAAQRFAAALARESPRADDAWWDRYARANLQLGLGRARRALGDADGALPSLRAGVTALEEIARKHPATTIDRRLGRARLELALALAESGARRAEVLPLATAAREWLKEAHAPAQELAALERVLK